MPIDTDFFCARAARKRPEFAQLFLSTGYLGPMGCNGEKSCARIGHNFYQDRLYGVGIRGIAWLMPSRPEMELESVVISVSVC
jgi:hypothetical protein